MNSVLSLFKAKHSITTKMSASKVLTLAVIACTSCASNVVAQSYNCDKYCLEDCSQYFPGPEFSSCVSANVHCSCHSKISIKNPFLIFVVVAIIVFSCFLFVLCYRFCQMKSGRPDPSMRTLAYPIAPITPSSGTTHSNGRRSSSSTSNGNRRPSQRNVTEGIVNPLAPQQSHDIPPEYLAPPPYNECVISMNTEEKSEKNDSC